MVRRPLLACPSDYDGPLRLVGRFLRKAAAPPRACAARLHMRATEGLTVCLLQVQRKVAATSARLWRRQDPQHLEVCSYLVG